MCPLSPARTQRRQLGNMKSRTLMFVTAMTLCAALALPLQPAAQHTRYRLIDIGTLGGTFGFANAINNKGWSLAAPITTRSEERRVGKECRTRWSPWT